MVAASIFQAASTGLNPRGSRKTTRWLLKLMKPHYREQVACTLPRTLIAQMALVTFNKAGWIFSCLHGLSPDEIKRQEVTPQ